MLQFSTIHAQVFFSNFFVFFSRVPASKTEASGTTIARRRATPCLANVQRCFNYSTRLLKVPLYANLRRRMTDYLAIVKGGYDERRREGRKEGRLGQRLTRMMARAGLYRSVCRIPLATEEEAWGDSAAPRRAAPCRGETRQMQDLKQIPVKLELIVQARQRRGERATGYK